MSKIVLDADAFKALASDTRLGILKALDARRLTVSELGRLLDLNKATVFEHLKQLAAAELVKKDDEGRKWIYYRLTWKGKRLLHPENTQIFLMLSMAVLGLGGAVAALGRALEWWLTETPMELDALMAPERASDQPAGDDARAPGPVAESGDAGLWTTLEFWAFVVLFLAAAVLLALAARFWLRQRRERRVIAAQIDTLRARSKAASTG